MTDFRVVSQNSVDFAVLVNFQSPILASLKRLVRGISHLRGQAEG
jgi:hypothetical protein